MMDTIRIKKEVSYDGLNDFYLIAEPVERKPRLLRRIIEARIDKKEE